MRKKKEIKTILCLPGDEQALRGFEKKLSDFYTAQVERKIQSLTKEKKIEVLELILK